MTKTCSKVDALRLRSTREQAARTRMPGGTRAGWRRRRRRRKSVKSTAFAPAPASNALSSQPHPQGHGGPMAGRGIKRSLTRGFQVLCLSVAAFACRLTLIQASAELSRKVDSLTPH